MKASEINIKRAETDVSARNSLLVNKKLWGRRAAASGRRSAPTLPHFPK